MTVNLLGDYSSISNWQTTEARDLVTNTDTEELEVAAADSESVSGPWTITGWTTSGTYYLEIRAKSGEHHLGVIGDGYVLTVTGDWVDAFMIGENNVVVSGFEIKDTVSQNSYSTIGASTAVNSIIIKDMLVRGGVNTNYGSGIIDGRDNSSLDVLIVDTIVYDGTAKGIVVGNYNSDFTVYNCGVHSSSNYAFSHRGGAYTDTFELRNSWEIVNTNACENAGDFEAASDYNATDEANDNNLPSGSFNVSSLNTATGQDFEDVSTNDFSIDADSALYRAGENLDSEYGTANPISGYTLSTNSIDGNTRPAAGSWDIGPFYVAAAGTVPHSPLGHPLIGPLGGPV